MIRLPLHVFCSTHDFRIVPANLPLPPPGVNEWSHEYGPDVEVAVGYVAEEKHYFSMPSF
eukprot:82265-Pleurochrysis_carterae.AAC.1